MSIEGFRPAELIELHDTGVCISVENRSAGIGWQEFLDYESSNFSIGGETLSHFAQVLGVNPKSISVKTPKGAKDLPPEHIEFQIHKKRQHVGEGGDSFIGCPDKIKNLWVKAEGAHFVHIRVEFFKEEEGKDKVYSKELTYSGSYSVWWK